MTLALPINIASRENREEILCALLLSLPSVYCHVWDGRLSGHLLTANELPNAAQQLGECTLIYLLEGSRARLEPIVGFNANQTLGRAQMQHCMDSCSNTSPGKLPSSTADRVAGIIRSMFAEHAWLNTVVVPGNMRSVDGLLGLKVVAGEISTITLVDAIHRPWSARK
jgi:hypothetical protein